MGRLAPGPAEEVHEHEALVDFQHYHPHPPTPERAKLADAHLVLARSYEASSWTRLVQSCQLIDAIWDDDVDTVRTLVIEHPYLLNENAGIRNNNWGPPLSYAANLGRDAPPAAGVRGADGRARTRRDEVELTVDMPGVQIYRDHLPVLNRIIAGVVDPYINPIA